MNSQRNEGMNRRIMRYALKEKTYSGTMAFTLRINIAIDVDCVGQAEFYERLSRRMNFWLSLLTFSGLCRMWRKKEYSRMYSGLKRVKKRRRLAATIKMIDDVEQMKLDAEEGH